MMAELKQHVINLQYQGITLLEAGIPDSPRQGVPSAEQGAKIIYIRAASLDDLERYAIQHAGHPPCGFVIAYEVDGLRVELGGLELAPNDLHIDHLITCGRPSLHSHFAPPVAVDTYEVALLCKEHADLINGLPTNTRIE